jgi:low affinity Fe/Cu permease
VTFCAEKSGKVKLTLLRLCEITSAYFASKPEVKVFFMKTVENHLGFNDWFGKIAARTSGWVGSPAAFVVAIALVILWAALGPHYHYSDTWQLIINTGTTVVTFLIVFLIQNTQNREARALHLKLDEVIRSIQAAHNDMIDIEKLSDGELAKLAKQYEHFRQEYETRSKDAAR